MKIDLLKLSRMMRQADNTTELGAMPYLSRDIMFYIAETDGADLKVGDIVEEFRNRGFFLTVRTHMDELEKNGFIKRKPCTKDGRVRYVVLTAKGRAAVKSYASALAQAA